MKIERFMVRLPKDAPLRKPTPVYAGLARLGESIRGGYVRLGERCYFLLVR